MNHILQTKIAPVSVLGWLLLCFPISAMTDIKGVNFKPGMPLPGQSLQESLSSPGEIQSLDQAVALYKNYPDILIEVQGNTDSSECKPSDCLVLSTRRAELVAGYLIEHGLSPTQIYDIAGFGSRRPLVDSANTDSAKEVNRRVEFVRKF